MHKIAFTSIRRNIFETNSSSCHSLAFCPNEDNYLQDYIYDKEVLYISTDEYHNYPEIICGIDDKLDYLFTLAICVDIQYGNLNNEGFYNDFKPESIINIIQSIFKKDLYKDKYPNLYYLISFLKKECPNLKFLVLDLNDDLDFSFSSENEFLFKCEIDHQSIIDIKSFLGNISLKDFLDNYAFKIIIDHD